MFGYQIHYTICFLGNLSTPGMKTVPKNIAKFDTWEMEAPGNGLLVSPINFTIKFRLLLMIVLSLPNNFLCGKD